MKYLEVQIDKLVERVFCRLFCKQVQFSVSLIIVPVTPSCSAVAVDPWPYALTGKMKSSWPFKDVVSQVAAHVAMVVHI